MIFENQRLDGLALFVITTLVLYFLGWHLMTLETYYKPTFGLYNDYNKCMNIGVTCYGFKFHDPIINIPIFSKIAVEGGVLVYFWSLLKIIFGRH